MSAIKRPMRPEVGMLITVHGKRCRIFKVHPAGTIDVVALDGSGAWRVSGLSL